MADLELNPKGGMHQRCLQGSSSWFLQHSVWGYFVYWLASYNVDKSSLLYMLTVEYGNEGKLSSRLPVEGRKIQRRSYHVQEGSPEPGRAECWLRGRLMKEKFWKDVCMIIYYCVFVL